MIIKLNHTNEIDFPIVTSLVGHCNWFASLIYLFSKDKMRDSLIETRPPKVTRSQSRPSSQIRGDQLLSQYYYLHKYMNSTKIMLVVQGGYISFRRKCYQW